MQIPSVKAGCRMSLIPDETATGNMSPRTADIDNPAPTAINPMGSAAWLRSVTVGPIIGGKAHPTVLKRAPNMQAWINGFFTQSTATPVMPLP